MINFIKCFLFGHIPIDYTSDSDDPDYTHGYCDRCGRDLF